MKQLPTKTVDKKQHHELMRAAQRRALIEIKWNRPDEWSRVMRWMALRALALSPETDFPDEVPLLPATPALIKEVHLIGECPGLREAIIGELQTWHKKTPLIMAAHDWAVANAHTLAAITSHAQRWYGLQFNKGGYAIKAFNHLLELIGCCGLHDGQVTIPGHGRQHLYRLLDYIETP